MADAPDSKSGGVHSPCGFESHLRHQHFIMGNLWIADKGTNVVVKFNPAD